MAVTGVGIGGDEQLRPALLMLGAALAVGGELDVRYATLGGGLELAMMGALAFLGPHPTWRLPARAGRYIEDGQRRRVPSVGVRFELAPGVRE
ncbi:MAG TPA: hypothetical protein VK506_12205 [Conexibacter sp.]|nr:hypothetical protein [Conexibacter sp.]